jgi:membrane-associated phospholipid phosphatase
MRPNNQRTITGRLIANRLKSEWVLKILLLILLNLGVYGPYLLLQHHNCFPTITMPLTSLDRFIPFWPQTVWCYLSIYLLMPIGPFLMNERQQILRYAAGIMLIGLVADAVFIFWPTSCPRPNAAGANAVYETLITIDNSLHAFPSLHAAFAIYSAMCGIRVVREVCDTGLLKGVLWVWAILILLSTLTTKQHVIADIVAGGLLGFGSYRWVYYPWKFNPSRKITAPTVTPNLTRTNSNMS